jgi:hypothetical protein
MCLPFPRIENAKINRLDEFLLLAKDKLLFNGRFVLNVTGNLKMQ